MEIATVNAWKTTMKKKWHPTILSILGLTLCLQSVRIHADDWGWISLDHPSDHVHNAVVEDQLILTAAGYSGALTVFRSYDRGAQWEQTATFPAGMDVMAMTRKNGVTVIALEPGGTSEPDGIVMFSVDDGENWTQAADFPNPSWPLCLEICHDGSVLAGLKYLGGCSVSRMTENGSNWEETGPLPEEIYLIWTLKEFEPDHLIGGGSSGDNDAICDSQDSGQTWLINHIPMGDSISVVSIASCAESYLACIANSNNLFKRELSGLNWTITGEIDSANYLTTLMTAVNGVTYAGTSVDQGTNPIFESLDCGETWSEMYIDPWSSSIRHLLESDDGFLYAVGNGRIYRSADPIIPPTPTPSVGPGTPTHTPVPPTATYTAVPTPTQTPTLLPPSPIPTTTPECNELGVDLVMPTSPIEPGTLF